MKLLDRQELIVPEWVVPVIINGDTSGLLEAEITKVREFEEEAHEHKPEGTRSVLIYFKEEEAGFYWSHALGKYGCNCVLCFIDYLGEE